MAAYESVCPVVSRGTVEMERKEGRRWVPFDAEILWLRQTAARNEYVRPGTRTLQRRGESFGDHFGFGAAVRVAAEVALATAHDGIFLKNCLKWEMLVKARSFEVPVMADESRAAAEFAERPGLGGRVRYQTIPEGWRVKATGKALVPVDPDGGEGRLVVARHAPGKPFDRGGLPGRGVPSGGSRTGHGIRSRPALTASRRKHVDTNPGAGSNPSPRHPSAAKDYMTDTDALARADTLEGFVDACGGIVRHSPHVRLLAAPLARFVPAVSACSPPPWDVEAGRGTDGSRWRSMAFAAANLGGFWETGPDGSVRQWEKDGSGSSAAMAWIRGMADHGLVPGVDWSSADPLAAAAREDIDLTLSGVPYAETRRAICEEFASPTSGARLDMALAPFVRGEDGMLSGELGVADAAMLATMFPASFGGDPFRKKAFLAILGLVSNLRSRGHDVGASIPVPADYQLPRLLHSAGAVGVSGEFEAELRAGGLMAAGSDRVTHLRAATVLACHELGRIAGRPDWVVDAALFGIIRGDPRLRAAAIPGMRIVGTWF